MRRGPLWRVLQRPRGLTDRGDDRRNGPHHSNTAVKPLSTTAIPTKELGHPRLRPQREAPGQHRAGRCGAGLDPLAGPGRPGATAATSSR